jgi:hypothetical protein
MNIHSCQLHCHTIDPEKLDIMGIEDDPGKWMSFAFHMDVVTAIKLTSDEEDNPLFGCTTVFTEQGDIYIIDTKYDEFMRKFMRYHADPASVDDNEINF